MENKSIVRERLSFPWCKARLSQARLSPAFLPDRCCAPGWTTPQLLTFGRLDASLQRCQDFFSSDISIISGIMEVKMVWRCQDKSFRPFFGFGAFRGVNVFSRKAWLRTLLWEMARCWSGNRSFLDTIRSISYRPGISCGDPSFWEGQTWRDMTYVRENLWHIFVSGLYIFVLMRHLWWKSMKEGDCEMPIDTL